MILTEWIGTYCGYLNSLPPQFLTLSQSFSLAPDWNVLHSLFLTLSSNHPFLPFSSTPISYHCFLPSFSPSFSPFFFPLLFIPLFTPISRPFLRLVWTYKRTEESKSRIREMAEKVQWTVSNRSAVIVLNPFPTSPLSPSHSLSLSHLSFSIYLSIYPPFSALLSLPLVLISLHFPSPHLTVLSS